MDLAISKFATDLACADIKFLSLASPLGGYRRRFLDPKYPSRFPNSVVTLGTADTDEIIAEQFTGDPGLRKWTLNALHKIGSDATEPVPEEKSVASQLCMIERLSAGDSEKFVGRFGDRRWF